MADKTLQLKVRVSPDLRKRLEESAVKHGLTLNSEVILRLLHSLEVMK